MFYNIYLIIVHYDNENRRNYFKTKHIFADILITGFTYLYENGNQIRMDLLNEITAVTQIFDSKGNLVNSLGKNNEVNYEYDDKHHPYKNIKPKNFIYFNRIGYDIHPDFNLRSANNITKIDQYWNDEIYQTHKFKYVYALDGFPIEKIAKPEPPFNMYYFGIYWTDIEYIYE